MTATEKLREEELRVETRSASEKLREEELRVEIRSAPTQLSTPQLSTSGKLWLEGSVWRLQVEPHVMIKVKAIFCRVNKAEFGCVTLKNSPEVCADLEWFIQRYPVEVLAEYELAAGAEEYRRGREQLQLLVSPEYRPQPLMLAIPARQYQLLGNEIYLQRKSLLLADQLGLGKSISAICSFTDARTLPALVVCQSHLPKQWARFVHEFLPGARSHIIKTGKLYKIPEADVYIITYHKLSGWAETLSKFIRSCVFDEIQELRHTGTGKYEAAKHVRAGAAYCLGLSATPIYNYGGEIFNVLEIIAPGMIGTRGEFEREWCTRRSMHTLLREPEAFGAYLRDQFIMVRRTRRDVGRELPPVERIVQTISHDEAVLKSIDTLATELAHRILSGASFHEKGEAAREFDMRLRQQTGISKAPSVAAFVRLLVEGGERVVLTGWHREVYRIYEEHLRQAGILLAYYTGTESPAEKDRNVKRFMDGEAGVFVLSLRSGVGLDGLQTHCSTIVHGELDWSMAIHEQCRGRIYRDGQADPVTEFFLVSEAGSDPFVSQVLGLKDAQARGILERDGLGLQFAQTDEGRVKRLAEEYLGRKKS